MQKDKVECINTAAVLSPSIGKLLITTESSVMLDYNGQKITAI